MFTARYGHSTLVLEMTMPGGHLLSVDKVEGFPGFPEGVGGYELCPMVQEQAADQGAEFDLAEARRLEWREPYWVVECSADSHRAKAVIVAAGSHPKALGIPGENEFLGKGVSNCATCDGPFYQDKVVCVVGGGDAALQEGLTLTEYAAQVVILHRGGELSAQQTYRQRCIDHPKVDLRRNAVVEAILGDDTVTGVRMRDAATGETSTIEAAGVFVYAGLEPNTALLNEVLTLDGRGRVPTDVWMQTEQPGLFAAGDVRSDSAAQAISSAGDGATAAVAAHRYIVGREWP
jgi:thioredoxin reductase (NADPH)